MRSAPADVGDTVRRRYYEPYRRDVETFVATAVAHGIRVVHVSSHSFTPSLDGDVRRADVGLLYDPARVRERDLCIRWQRALKARAADWIVRRNYPYLGRSDGLTSYLRKRYCDDAYAGIELEANQKRVRDGAFPARDRHVITAALLDALVSQRATGPSDAR